MNNKSKKIIFLGFLILVLFLGWFFFVRVPEQDDGNIPGTVVVTTETAIPIETTTPVEDVQPTPEAPKPVKPIKKVDPKRPETPVVAAQPDKPKPPRKSILPPDVSLAPSPIQIHKELIPKNIEIVRVYYERELTGPGSVVEFDVNGSGFTKEFEKMIKVESGDTEVDVKNLSLITPNQIHGILIIKSSAKTGVIFPRVLIQDKVVFRAPEPFAVIRPGEVLNMIFTEMGENGRWGRFRIFTNLTSNMYPALSVTSSTGSIVIGDFRPSLPFIVDGTIAIGNTLLGAHDLTVRLGDQTIWQRIGIIRIVQPNVGQSGLIHSLRALDGFHRPGDQAKFLIQGSGFQPDDVNLLKARVESLDEAETSFIFKAAGRMELMAKIPSQAKPGTYAITIHQADKVVMNSDKAFTIVGENWTRALKLDPALKPGMSGSLILSGRDMSKTFIEGIKSDVDVEDLTVGSFEWRSPEEAVAKVMTGANILPGDYLLKMTSNGQAVVPNSGSIIRINKN